ncbi:hypothetical protein [Nonomuraea cavernae]|uniref:Uncharacterized protein n=1 Tax=Nonomuraea cavernae TaxID=2045107 RepID=A0A917ZGJ9_9ACTN|nr:hypothetical protein [Nonomuraea cavernae]MCA2190027.1 hypothetical protein [Nonomuraea cavernae]GGO81482.1 hypothetical protein GCM10012289_70540 [Nonomuraea cavernae]
MSIRYDLADYRTGGIPSDPGVRARTADLARVTATFRAQTASSVPAAFERSAAFRDGGRIMFNGPTAVQAPGTLINYVTPHRELLWHGWFSDASGVYQLSDEQGRALRRGHHAELWNAAVTGPAAPTLTRTGDVLHEARLENCRLDRRCGFKTELAGAAATYTLGVSARRDVAHSSLTTAIDSVWTFASGRTTGTRALDLPSVKYTPEGLDAHNRARAGSDTTITIAGTARRCGRCRWRRPSTTAAPGGPRGRDRRSRR